ncbi:MAG: transcriptional regulator, MarR family [Firmicutes bacterium]|nr:transcriptional regulator, MarR family [Bacillota bacterium]
MTSTSFSKLKDSITELVQTYREAYRMNMLAELPDMTFRQFVYLDTIVRMNNPTYGEVAEKFKVTKPAVTAIVNKLIALGYLERVQSLEDRRIHHLWVNEKGKKLTEVETNTATKYVMSMEACLTKEEQKQFVLIVSKIIANCASKKK